MSSNLPAQPTVLQRVCTAYENSLLLPFFVPFLNAAGLGGIDRLASKHATDFQFKRVRYLIAALDRKVDKTITQPGSDDFYAALHTSLDAVMQTQSHEKVERFATVLAGTWDSQSSNWNEVSQTLRLIRDLEDIHIRILNEARKLEEIRTNSTFTIGNSGYSTSVPLDEKLAGIDPRLLQLCLSDLTAKGLLNDSFNQVKSTAFGSSADINKPPTPSKIAYSISPLGLWFLDSIANPDWAGHSTSHS